MHRRQQAEEDIRIQTPKSIELRFQLLVAALGVQWEPQWDIWEY